MRNVHKDEYGFMTVDGRGHAHRGPEYEARFSELERISDGVSGWRREGTGFTTIYPIDSAAHRRIIEGIVAKVRSREKIERRSRPGAEGVITAKSTPRVGRHDPWDCDDWISWHRALVADHGDQEADRLWRNAWLDTQPAPIDMRTATPEFRAYIATRPTLAYAVHTIDMPPPPPTASSELRVGESPRSTGIPLGAIAVAGLIGGGIWLWWNKRKQPHAANHPQIPVMMYLPGGVPR